MKQSPQNCFAFCCMIKFMIRLSASSLAPSGAQSDKHNIALCLNYVKVFWGYYSGNNNTQLLHEINHQARSLPAGLVQCRRWFVWVVRLSRRQCSVQFRNVAFFCSSLVKSKPKWQRPEDQIRSLPPPPAPPRPPPPQKKKEEEEEEEEKVVVVVGMNNNLIEAPNETLIHKHLYLFHLFRPACPFCSMPL